MGSGVSTGFAWGWHGPHGNGMGPGPHGDKPTGPQSREQQHHRIHGQSQQPANYSTGTAAELSEKRCAVVVEDVSKCLSV
jgi:hypothetical protein